MPTYEVTDSLTGKTYELDGSSPPTEQELSEIFGGARADTLSAGQPQGSIPLSQRAQFVEKDIAQRPDLLSRGGADLAEAVLGAPKRPWEETAQQLGGSALDIISGAFQRPMAAITNPIVEMQQPPEMKSANAAKEVGDVAQSIVRGLTGERLTSPKDIARYAGAGMGAAQGIEAASYAVTPENLVAGAARLGAKRGIVMASKALGKKVMPSAAMVIHDIPEGMKNDIVASRGIAFEGPTHFKDGRLGDTVKDIAAQVSKDIKKPASEAWNNLGPQAIKIELPSTYVDDLANTLEVKYADAIKTGRDEGALSGFIARLRQLGKEPGVTRTSIFDDFEKIQQTKPITLKDVIDLKADLRNRSESSITAMHAASDVGKKLADDFPIVQKANSEWARWRQADDALRSAGIRVTPEAEGGLGVQGASTRVASYYDKKFQLAKDALEGNPKNTSPSLLDVYRNAGLDESGISERINQMKYALQANAFTSKAPIGSAVVGRYIALPIGIGLGASLGGAQGAMVGGAASMLFSSPRSFSRILRNSLKDSPRKRLLDELAERGVTAKTFDIGATAAVNMAAQEQPQE